VQFANVLDLKDLLHDLIIFMLGINRFYHSVLL